MALLSDLVLALSAATGLPPATVFAYGRFAREAGQISQKGRGRGAAEVTIEDAANLLIAVGATAITREAGAAIKSYRRLKGHYFVPLEKSGKKIQRWLGELGSTRVGTNYRSLDSNLGQFVEFLIRQTLKSELNKLLRSIPVLASGEGNFNLLLKHPGFTVDMLLEEGASSEPGDPSLGSQVGIKLCFHRLSPFARVEFFRFGVVGEEQLFSLVFGDVDADDGYGDFSVEAYLTELSIAALGACLSGQAINFKNKSMLRRALFPKVAAGRQS